VELELRQSESDRLELRIEDDGVGFDVAAVLRAGISVGMRSMHARIARVGGELDVASQPGRTALTATLGLRTPQA
jgi:signal transduction histidine kinase